MRFANFARRSLVGSTAALIASCNGGGPQVAPAPPLAPIQQYASHGSKWYVDGINGSDSNNCKSRGTACKTIGHAIALASSGDSIVVGGATYAENLAITFNLKIIGGGRSITIVDGGAVSTVVSVSYGAQVTISKVTIRNGRAHCGGGILNSGVLTLNDSTISGNAAAAQGNRGSGGGICNDGTLTINNTTVSGNHASSYGRYLGFGGGIYNAANLTINGSTLSGNEAEVGGGIYQSTGYGNVNVNDSTLSENSQGAIYTNINGGGSLTLNSSTIGDNSGYGLGSPRGVYLRNSIVADTRNGSNCGGGQPPISYGYNLSSDSSCSLSGTGDLNDIDPKLGALQNNGGPTQTMALLAGSPAIDAGNPGGCVDGQSHLLKIDQRGARRPDKEDTGGCDMGAFERRND